MALCNVLSASAAAPPLAAPLGVPITAERVELGRKLFFDPRLSENATVSCATCHNPDQGWSDGARVAVGIFGRTGRRNSPSIINAAYAPLLFHDGRTIGLATQATQPIVNRLEMGDQSEQQVLDRLRRIPGYVRLFEVAYGVKAVGQSPIDRNRYGHALASFESTIISFDAPIDRRLAGDGWGLFLKANCMACHAYPLFTSLTFANNAFEFATKSRPTDRGRAAVAGESARPGTIRAFKVTSLREVQRTAPYGHAGSLPDLARVVRHYSVGGSRFNGLRDPFMDERIHPLNLSTNQEEMLVAFLEEAFASNSYPHVVRPVLP